MSEAEVHWRAFLDSLIQRGLRGVKFIASDDHAGLKTARKAMFPGVPWQRCQFHLQHNAQGYVSTLDQRTPVARQIAQLPVFDGMALLPTFCPQSRTWSL